MPSAVLGFDAAALNELKTTINSDIRNALNPTVPAPASTLDKLDHIIILLERLNAKLDAFPTTSPPIATFVPAPSPPVAATQPSNVTSPEGIPTAATVIHPVRRDLPRSHSSPSSLPLPRPSAHHHVRRSTANPPLSRPGLNSAPRQSWRNLKRIDSVEKGSNSVRSISRTVRMASLLYCRVSSLRFRENYRPK